MAYRWAFLFTVLSFGFFGCVDNSSSPKKTDNIVTTHQKAREPNRDNYLSGRAFCDHYKELTSKEHGQFISVPRDYKRPHLGNIQIYAWTINPFRPELPTMIYVDGGPGQNSHGRSAFLGTEWNEISFDQRGLGCSAPATFDEYMDSSQYSSSNVVLDMNEIRKAYDISKWSVYGVSYGTIPATRYASQFSNFTKALVLEGAVYDEKDIHQANWKAEKFNALLRELTWDKRQGYEKLLKSYPAEVELFNNLAIYYDNGFRTVLNILNSVILDNYRLDNSLLKKIRLSIDEIEKKYSRPQRPQGTDKRVNFSIFCKELGLGSDHYAYVNYDFSQQKYTNTIIPKSDMAEFCEALGISLHDRESYVAAQFPVSVPVTYFHGSHDGATLVQGAMKHWRSVPRGKVNFLLARKGGHNPNASRLVEVGPSQGLSQKFGNDISNQIYTSQMNLFEAALRGETISKRSVDAANQFLTEDTKWLLYQNAPKQMWPIESEANGISLRPAVMGF